LMPLGQYQIDTGPGGGSTLFRHVPMDESPRALVVTLAGPKSRQPMVASIQYDPPRMSARTRSAK
jgi:hypothetical protein